MRVACLLLVSVFGFGCSSEITPATPADTGPAEAACVRFDAGPAMEVAPPADTEGTDDSAVMDTAPPTATISRAELDDIIKNSCAFSSCHGRSPGAGKLFLPAPPNNWVVEIVNKPSTAHPTMKRVVPGDPSNSFFVHKLTDGLCALHKECVGGDCGVRMPQTSDPLLKQDLDKIIEWIRQGASEK
jgi:hypothetical protein